MNSYFFPRLYLVGPEILSGRDFMLAPHSTIPLIRSCPHTHTHTNLDKYTPKHTHAHTNTRAFTCKPTHTFLNCLHHMSSGLCLTFAAVLKTIGWSPRLAHLLVDAMRKQSQSQCSLHLVRRLARLLLLLLLLLLL